MGFTGLFCKYCRNTIDLNNAKNDYIICQCKKTKLEYDKLEKSWTVVDGEMFRI